MVVRTDYIAIYGLSPRLLIFDSPSVSLSLQDWIDTANTESNKIANMDKLRLMDGVGKTDIGGGLKTGLIATNQDVKIGFEQRTTSISSGTVTTPDSTGRTLTDSAATFITDGVKAGDVILNLTDNGAVGTVRNVISETQLVTIWTMADGTNNQFNMSDSYKIWTWTEVKITAGDMVAVDNAPTPVAINPIIPTFGTYVTRELSTSGALVDDARFDRLLGLMLENTIVDLTTFDTESPPNLISARHRSFPSKTLADAATIDIADPPNEGENYIWDQTAVFEAGTNKFSHYKMVLRP